MSKLFLICGRKITDLKELSLYHKLRFLTLISLQLNVVDIRYLAMNSVRSINLNLNYLRFTLSGSKDIGIRKFDFVAKTQFLCT